MATKSVGVANLTFTRDGEQNQATRLPNVRLDQVSDQRYIQGVPSLTDADDQPFTNRAIVREQQEPPSSEGITYRVDHKTTSRSDPGR